uniref:Odorant receptor n=1 Tax=Helicoverpa armigera TaxID=29058 RepID=A0A172QGF5_HELAM|nr:olfactory receptor 12 [Helicoverpa armigera]
MMEEEPLLIDKTVKKIEFLFRCTGINIKSGTKTRKDMIKSRTVYIINFLWLNIDLAGAVMWFFTGIANSKSFTELTYVAPCITLSFLGNLKSLFLILREKHVDKLIQVLRDLEINEKARPKSEETDAIIKYEHNFVTTVISVLNVLYFVLLVAFALSPVSLVALKYFTTNELELLLPFLIVYPFDPYDIRYWPWVYLRQIWSEVVVIIDICTADYLFYTFCTYIRMQFRLLKHYIERVIPEEDASGRLTNIEDVRAEFVLLIKWHQDLISSANMLETVYTRSTLFNFVSSSVLICLTGFNVMAISDVAFVATFLSFLFMSLLQIFFLCFFGDLLMTSSTEISEAVYNCRWYLADTSLGKDLLLVQTRAQTPCKLTASDFSEVNLKAFMKILSTAWSYFALLQTLYGAPT